MQCEQARQLFDAYLDGELSPSLATELGAHRLRCPDCRQALALLEVSGHILRSDRDSVRASDDFTDRLLACVETVSPWRVKAMRILTIGGPLAAAAVIALAFLGVFDNKGPSQVAGVQELAPAVVQTAQPAPSPKAMAPSATIDPAEKALGEFIDQTQTRMKDNGESVQRVLDLTVLQMLDILEEAKVRSELRGRNDSHTLAPIAPKPEAEEHFEGKEDNSNPLDNANPPTPEDEHSQDEP